MIHGGSNTHFLDRICVTNLAGIGSKPGPTTKDCWKAGKLDKLSEADQPLTAKELGRMAVLGWGALTPTENMGKDIVTASVHKRKVPPTLQRGGYGQRLQREKANDRPPQHTGLTAQDGGKRWQQGRWGKCCWSRTEELGTDFRWRRYLRGPGWNSEQSEQLRHQGMIKAGAGRDDASKQNVFWHTRR